MVSKQKATVLLRHFQRAVADIAAHGDNDTLPFDIDNRFIAENQGSLSELAYTFFQSLEQGGKKAALTRLSEIQVFSERLLVPTGAAGFRITTKIHPFWNIYFNGLGVAIAEAHESKRSPRAFSYRFTASGEGLFDRQSSWRKYREITVLDTGVGLSDAVVVQTDISSFYEHIYHHRIENSLNDIFGSNSTIPLQIDRLLSKFASGRSFGLPVGGQCSRILAEVLMASIDQTLSDAGISWYRYVDDITLVSRNQADAYRSLSVLSHSLADYGLTLNRTKTVILSAKHYIDFVRAQLGTPDDDAGILREIDLHFDPYSDNAVADYEDLRETVEKLDVQTLLHLELQKGQPDTFLVAQIGRTLKLQSPEVALTLCATLLAPQNLHSFRASWSTIMKGVSAVRADERYSSIAPIIDNLLDQIPSNAPHLLLPEANCLHFMRTLRFRHTPARANFVLNQVYEVTNSESLKRACIDCWRHWGERANFTRMVNRWSSMGAEEQRMVWVAAKDFGDEGKHFRKQVGNTLANSWRLGIESEKTNSFATIFANWG